MDASGSSTRAILLFNHDARRTWIHAHRRGGTFTSGSATRAVFGRVRTVFEANRRELPEAMSAVVVFEISDSRVDCPMLETLARAENLRWLSIGRCEIDRNAAVSLSKLQALRRLILGGIDPLPDEVLVAIAPLPWLRELWVIDTPLCDEQLVHLVGMVQITDLWLSSTAITDNALTTIGKLPRLTKLALDGTRVTDEGLPHLAGLLRLESLILWNTAITGEGLPALASCPKLTSLGLRGTRIDDRRNTWSAQLPALEEVDLRQTIISDCSLVVLASLNCETISVDGTLLTPKGRFMLALVAAQRRFSRESECCITSK